MKSEGWRDVRKGFKPQLQGTESFCVSVVKVGHWFSDFAENVCCLVVHMCGCVYMYVHAAKDGIA